MIYLWLMASIYFGYAASIAAGLRNRNTLLWYWCGFAGTVFGLIAVMALPPRAALPHPVGRDLSRRPDPRTRAG